MSKSFLCFLFERTDEDESVIAVCKREYLGRIYKALEEDLDVDSQEELMQRFPNEKVYSDKFTYDHESNTVMYEGIAYQRNPEYIKVDSGSTRIEIK